MSQVVGGLRTRFVVDSLLAAITSGLAALGWFDPGRAHAPIIVHSGVHRTETSDVLNAIYLSARGAQSAYLETGSLLMADRLDIDIDFYAESDSLGVHVTNDIRDLLRGRLGTVANVAGRIPVYDYRLATPAPVTAATISEVDIARRLPIATRDFERHIHTVTCVAETAYAGEYS